MRDAGFGLHWLPEPAVFVSPYVTGAFTGTTKTPHSRPLGVVSFRVLVLHRTCSWSSQHDGGYYDPMDARIPPTYPFNTSNRSRAKNRQDGDRYNYTRGYPPLAYVLHNTRSTKSSQREPKLSCSRKGLTSPYWRQGLGFRWTWRTESQFTHHWTWIPSCEPRWWLNSCFNTQ